TRARGAPTSTASRSSGSAPPATSSAWRSTRTHATSSATTSRTSSTPTACSGCSPGPSTWCWTAAELQTELRHRAERVDVAVELQLGDAALAPHLEVVADLLLGPDQRGLLDERLRHGGRGLVLPACEVQVLDRAGLGLVAHPGEDVGVEVHLARAHPAD